MITQNELEENWHEIKGKLQSKWGSLTEDGLQVADGNVEQLLGTIQRRTGEAREGIEEFFEQFSLDGASAMSRVSEAARNAAHQTAESVQNAAHKAAATVREKYAEVEDIVRRRPGTSLAVCIGAGVIVGLVALRFYRGNKGTRNKFWAWRT